MDKNKLTRHSVDLFKVGHNIEIFVTEPLSAETLEKEYKHIRQDVAADYQRYCESHFSRWNYYIVYVAEDISTVDPNLIYKIEHDTYSSRKFVVDAKESGENPAQYIIDRYLRYGTGTKSGYTTKISEITIKDFHGFKNWNISFMNKLPYKPASLICICGGSVTGKTTIAESIRKKKANALGEHSSNDKAMALSDEKYIKDVLYSATRVERTEFLSRSQECMRNICNNIAKAINNDERIVLDDPEVYLDDIGIVMLIDMLRNLAVDGYQVIITTRDESFYNLVETKMPANLFNTKFIKLVAPGVAEDCTRY